MTTNDGARDEFEIPDVPDKPCLLLRPDLNLLTLIFSDQAFAAPELTPSKQLFRLRIPLGQKQLPVPLEKEMRHIPSFHPSENTVNGVCVSNDEVLSDGALRSWMVTWKRHGHRASHGVRKLLGAAIAKLSTTAASITTVIFFKF